MKVCVLNGSPKGDLSVTKRYVDYLDLKYPSDDFIFLNISKEIRKIESDGDFLDVILDEVENSDAVLWAFPVYYCLVPSQYKRFIEVLFEKDRTRSFEGKYAAAVSTSIHFFDNTAHNYIHAVSDDLNMKYAGFFSAKMNDLLDEDKRRNLDLFWQRFENSVLEKREIQKYYMPVVNGSFSYEPSLSRKNTVLSQKKVIILTDDDGKKSNALKMSEKLGSLSGGGAEIINLNNLGMKGGCQGCIRCGFDNECIYNDGFSYWYEKVLLSADVIVFSCTVKDRYISSIWKQFFDRSFFRGHVPGFPGKTVGIMVSGPYSQTENIREILEGYLSMNSGYPAGIISDESESSEITDRIIEDFAGNLAFASENSYRPPQTFTVAGGRKIFRDEVWGDLRPVFRADHRYYKKAGLYDFPQKNYKKRLGNFGLSVLFSIPPVNKSAPLRFKQEMVKPLDRLLEKISSD